MGLLWAGAGITAGVGAMLAGHWGSIHRERRFMVLVPASAAAILDVHEFVRWIVGTVIDVAANFYGLDDLVCLAVHDVESAGRVGIRDE